MSALRFGEGPWKIGATCIAFADTDATRRQSRHAQMSDARNEVFGGARWILSMFENPLSKHTHFRQAEMVTKVLKIHRHRFWPLWL